MGGRNGDTSRADAGQSKLRALVFITGVVMMAAGAVVVATNYSDDYSCTVDLRCLDSDGFEPSDADRAVAAFGFGLEQGPRSDLPGPEGTLLLAAGAALLLLVLVIRPSHPHDPRLEEELPPPRPAPPEHTGPRQRMFIDR